MTRDGLHRDFLLGRLPEREAERLEVQVLEDEEAFQTLCSVEDDLFDAFARGRLDAAEQAAFVQRYGGRKARLTFASALARRQARVLPFARRPWLGLAAAAAVVVAVGGLLTRPPEMRETPGAGGPERAAVVRPGTSAGPVAGPAVLLDVALGVSRAGQAAPTVTLPADAGTIQVRVRLHPGDRFDRYAAELRSASGTVVWGNDALQAASEGGARALSFAVPARSLAAGSYELAVRGGGEDLGFVTIEVRRN